MSPKLDLTCLLLELVRPFGVSAQTWKKPYIVKRIRVSRSLILQEISCHR